MTRFRFDKVKRYCCICGNELRWNKRRGAPSKHCKRCKLRCIEGRRLRALKSIDRSSNYFSVNSFISRWADKMN